MPRIGVSIGIIPDFTSGGGGSGGQPARTFDACGYNIVAPAGDATGARTRLQHPRIALSGVWLVNAQRYALAAVGTAATQPYTAFVVGLARSSCWAPDIPVVVTSLEGFAPFFTAVLVAG